MSGPLSASSKLPDDFLERARQLLLLDEKAVERLREASQSSDLSPEALALREGLLDATQIDIIDALRDPEAIVPGYEILDVIAQGGMGVVFRARQRSLDRAVAIKTILVNQMHDQTALTRFQQEAVAVARLRHPNIVAAHDLGRHAGRLFFVMELVEGKDVERVLQSEGPFSESVTWGLIRQAAAGLSHAAAAGIVHRDIKPANLILVDPPAGFELAGGRKMVKITDFGLAFLTRDVEVKTRLTSANAAIGSPHYIAPEQLGGNAVDHRVDIYSLGATAYHMLAGEPPFHGKTLPQIITAKLSADSIDLRAKVPGASLESADLIARMTRRDPNTRLGSYAELMSRIDEMTFDSQTDTAPFPIAVSPTGPTIVIRSDPTPDSVPRDTLPLVPPPRPAPVRSAVFGRRPFLRLSGGLVLAAAGYGAWFWSTRPRPNPPLFPTGLTVNLFDGISLAGWRTQTGAWTVRKNHEGGRVLSGTSGNSLRPLFGGREHRAELRAYRISLGIQFNGATSAEIEFGFDRRDPDEGERGVVQLTAKQVLVARRRGSEGTLKEASAPVALSAKSDEPYSITVDRQIGAWNVFVDQKPVGSLAAGDYPIETYFSLRAIGGEAWFSDVVLQALGPAAQESSAP